MDERKKGFIDFLKSHYRKGLKVRLLWMDDPMAPPSGTIGEVQGVDDAGNILVHWSNGSSLSLIPMVDQFEEIL